MSKHKKEYHIFDLIIGENYQSGGEAKTSWTSVGTVFRDKANGKISGRIKDGLALSGSFIIRAREEKPDFAPRVDDTNSTQNEPG